MSKVFRLGLFVVTALVIFGAGVFLIGSKKMMFRSTYKLNADFRNVGGLDSGAEVRIAGYHQGSVTRINLPKKPDGDVIVSMDLENSTRQTIRKDSVASIASEGLVGDKYVEITLGSKDSPEVKNGDTIKGAPPIQMADLLKKADHVLDSATESVEQIGASAGNLKTITGKINSGQGTVGALINDKTIYKEAASGATEFQEDMEALKHNFLLRGFFKKRGYEDVSELKQHELQHLPAQPSEKKFVYDSAKLFNKPDAAELKHQKNLNDAGRFLEQNNYGLVVVAAHTGMKGDTEKDKSLTEAQSMVVREYLAKNFKFDDSRLKTFGLGKNSEDDSNRVEILVYPR